jgi:hypothetical protein
MTRKGVYMLYSRFPDGRFLYRIGSSENIDNRISSYPPNWYVFFTYICRNQNIENFKGRIIKILENNKENLCIIDFYRSSEYFDSSIDCREEIQNIICEKIPYLERSFHLYSMYFHHDPLRYNKKWLSSQKDMTTTEKLVNETQERTINKLFLPIFVLILYLHSKLTKKSKHLGI